MVIYTGRFLDYHTLFLVFFGVLFSFQNHDMNYFSGHADFLCDFEVWLFHMALKCGAVCHWYLILDRNPVGSFDVVCDNPPRFRANSGEVLYRNP